MASPIRVWDVVIFLDLKQMGACLELIKGDLEAVHLFSKCICRFANKSISQHHEMLRKKINLGAETLKGGDPSDLDVLVFGVTPNVFSPS